ncbi:MAG: InlB B-repeat-containing protein [Bacilli bacterium]|nr:InlB B-repeat-containing protein [Bacilli bacterium]
MGKKRLLILAGAAVFGTSCATSLTSSSPTGSDGVNKYNVTFDFNGGSYKADDESEPVTSIQIPDVSYSTYFYFVKSKLTGTLTPPAHYKFKGYSLFKDDNINMVSDKYTIEGNTTFYAQYDIQDKFADIKWIDDFDSQKPAVMKEEKLFINDTPDPNTVKLPYHDGYQLDKWLDKEGEEVTEFTKITQDDIEGGGREYHATWKVPAPTTHTVTLNYNNDPKGEDPTIATQTVIDQGKAVEPRIEYEGHVINRWIVDGSDPETVFKFDDPITADITIKAIWDTVATQFVVSFNALGGTITGGASYLRVPGGTTIDESNKPTVTPPLGDEQEAPVWYTEPTFENEFIFTTKTSTEGTIVESDLTLYAKYNYRPAASFENDSWRAFLGEIKGKTIAQLHAEGAPYRDEYDLEGGASGNGNGYLGLSRNIEYIADDGTTQTARAVVVHEDQQAKADQPKFTFMVTGLFTGDNEVSYGADACYEKSTARTITKSFLPKIKSAELRDGIVADADHAQQSFDPVAYTPADPLPPITYNSIQDKLYVPSLFQMTGEAVTIDDTHTISEESCGQEATLTGQFLLFTAEHIGLLEEKEITLGDIWLRTAEGISEENVSYYDRTLPDSYDFDTVLTKQEGQPGVFAKHSLCLTFNI